MVSKKPDSGDGGSPSNPKSKGYGFITYADGDAVVDAVITHKHIINNKQAEVDAPEVPARLPKKGNRVAEKVIEKKVSKTKRKAKKKKQPLNEQESNKKPSTFELQEEQKLNKQPSSKTLYIKGYSPSEDPEIWKASLVSHLAEGKCYVNVNEVVITTTGYAYIDFKDDAAFTSALNLHESVLNRKTVLQITESKPKEEVNNRFRRQPSVPTAAAAAMETHPPREINMIGNPLIRRFGTRKRRRDFANFMRDHTDVSTVVKHPIHAGGDSRITFTETSIKIPWVGVHGIDSICVVSLSKHLLPWDEKPEMQRFYYGTSRRLFDIWNIMISEVEDIAAPLSKSRRNPYSVGPPGPCQMLHKCKKSPFGVVSVSKEDMDKKGSMAKYDVEGAIKFLQEEMESSSNFTFDTTTQTAISAFQHLFCKKFEAHEIRVFVLKNDETHGRELARSREGCDLEEFLAMIDGEA